MIRNGDTVFCIKDYPEPSKGSEHYTYFKKGEQYRIHAPEEDDNVSNLAFSEIIFIKAQSDFNFAFNLENFSRRKMTGWCKICPKAGKCKRTGAPYFDKYFITVRGQRLKKLKKLYVNQQGR